MSQDNHIVRGFELFKKRIAPARMVENGEVGNSNATLLGKYLRATGYNAATMTAEEISDACFRAAGNDDLLRKIVWAVEPASLRKYRENEKGINNIDAQKQQENFVEKARAAEAKKLADKKQAEALKRTYALIASFQLTDGARIMHGRTSLAQDKARKFVERQIAAKTDAEAIERAVRSYLDDLYKEDERNRERV